jgi:hypothetical protein
LVNLETLPKQQSKTIYGKEALKDQNIKTGPPDEWEVKWYKNNTKWADGSTLLHVMPN